MIILSWNINGIRSAAKKDLLPLITSHEYDILAFQEIKSDVLPLAIRSDDYEPFIFPSTTKKGYSGTLILTRIKPLSVIYGIGVDKFDSEGRVLTIELPSFYLINAYFPNSRRDLSRLKFKLEFDAAIESYMERLSNKKPVVLCGDLNVAHTELDIARPAENAGNAGFTPKERRWLTSLLKKGYLDTYRIFVKDGGHYTWWTYRFDARTKNIGWRIDYFLVSNGLKDRPAGAGILNNMTGSDHAPVWLELK